MAVKEESFQPTESLILPTPRKYYQALLYNSHWQLRSLISSPQLGTVYYPSASDIIALNTKTHERETVAVLNFAPRCLAANKEWVCVGGENGTYAAVSLKEKRILSELSTPLDFDPDARLPLDLDLSPSHRASIRESMRRPRPPPQTATAKITKVGIETVNCVTIWSPTTEREESAYTIPVSVIASNDKKVTIMNLEKSEIMQQLDFPDNLNRSVISPDGSLLATVSDDPYLYIHKRQRKQRSKKDPWNPSSDPNLEHEWVSLCKIQLEGQRPTEKSEMRGSFAVCFSSSGRYLAIATQHGLISVFDVATITDKESLVAVLTTSRPSTDRDVGGAARAMEFSPGPYDLLAWTEHTGRVGIADVRTMFFSKQIIIMDHNGDGVEKIHVSEKSYRDVIDPRLRPVQTESPLTWIPSMSPVPDYLGLDFDRRQLRHLTREMQDRHQSPLTAEEMDVLNAHRFQRRQRDAAHAAREALAEATNVSRLVSSNIEGDEGRTSASASTLPAALREFVNPDRAGAASFRNFINERNQDRERRSQNRQLPMQYLAALAADAGGARENGGSSEARDSSDTASLLDRLSLSSRQPIIAAASSSNNPWGAIDAIYRNRYSEDSLAESSARLRADLEEDRRDFAHRLRQPWRPLGDDSSGTSMTTPGLTILEREALTNARQALRQFSATNRPGGTIETMGCCWSEDGRILYAGGSNGIYEYHVNITGRKIFPSIVLR